MSLNRLLVGVQEPIRVAVALGQVLVKKELSVVAEQLAQILALLFLHQLVEEALGGSGKQLFQHETELQRAGGNGEEVAQRRVVHGGGRLGAAPENVGNLVELFA